MAEDVRIGLIGDYRPEVVAHVCIPHALELAATAVGVAVSSEWIATEAVKDPAVTLVAFNGLWLVPASPYRSMAGALAAVRFARESGRPFLGTCGGFQHALLELARNVAGITAADHAETNPTATDLVVTRLSCSLVSQTGRIVYTPGSQLHALCEGGATREAYHCNYGLNASWRTRLESAGLRFTGRDETGELRAAELPGHPFFVGTLFQPERSAPTGHAHPLIRGFLRAAAAFAVSR